MRLLHAETIQPISFEGGTIPWYAILSHTWGTDEVSFQDIQRPDDALSKAGYAKIRYACQETLRRGLKYVWVDTCCIDKTSSAELSEAINSMFHWYKDARVCFAYLSDVPDGTDVNSAESAFATSRWFSRGWTLQELLAPTELYFFSSNWRQLGSKKRLRKQTSEITGVGEGFMTGVNSLSEASIAKRMSWASRRETTRTEDLAYCLLGIFGISMPLLYGEGERAFVRLQEEIMKTSDDQTLFAWEYEDHDFGFSIQPSKDSTYSPFARSPASFKKSGEFIPDELNETRTSYAMTNKGLQINLPIIKLSHESYLAALTCRPQNLFHRVIAIPISFHGPDSVTRIERRKLCIILRYEVTHAPRQSLRFPMEKIDNVFSRFDDRLFLRPSLLIRNLPRDRSRWCILKVEPDDIWDPEQRVIRLSVHEKRHIVIRLWESEGEGFAIVLSIDLFRKDRQYVLHMVFQQSHSQPLSYNTLASSNLPINRIPDDVRVTIGKENIRMSTGIVIRTLDIEFISDIELETGQVN
jgi:hypothetical protein